MTICLSVNITNFGAEKDQLPRKIATDSWAIVTLHTIKVNQLPYSHAGTGAAH